MSSMFYNCISVYKIKFTNFNTDNVTDVSSMFYQCSSLKKLNLSNFNIINVSNFSNMFCRTYIKIT